MNHLVPCPECSRHVRVSETQCPFCALPLDLASLPEPVLPRERLSRAATFAFGATLASATALAACSATEVPVPHYGAPTPPISSGGNAGSSGSGGDSAGGGNVIGPVYGAPAAGGVGNSNPNSGNSGGSAPIPVYGAAP
jgi:hypothetical protein